MSREKKTDWRRLETKSARLGDRANRREGEWIQGFFKDSKPVTRRMLVSSLEIKVGVSLGQQEDKSNELFWIY